jgi:hypothetical protein
MVNRNAYNRPLRTTFEAMTDIPHVRNYDANTLACWLSDVVRLGVFWLACGTAVTYVALLLTKWL